MFHETVHVIVGNPITFQMSHETVHVIVGNPITFHMSHETVHVIVGNPMLDAFPRSAGDHLAQNFLRKI
jgi:hypothetical protein